MDVSTTSEMSQLGRSYHIIYPVDTYVIKLYFTVVYFLVIKHFTYILSSDCIKLYTVSAYMVSCW